MKIGFIGIGKVGSALASNLSRSGHKIIIGNENAAYDSVKKALDLNPEFTLRSIQQAVDESDIIFLATPFPVIGDALKGIEFSGKTLVDCTNPVGKGISHGLESVKSGSEVVQALAQDAKVVKAFSIYGFENFQDSSFPQYNVKPVMLIAGDNINAKNEVAALIEELGFSAMDTGDLSQALHLEHMTLLWVKMVRANGHNPRFVWASLEK
jgi:8-hydroxy-5-deazaflavin:NADPH oxidoreductase